MISKLEELKQLLWEQWDPIGVRDLGSPDDEYNAYAFEIWMRLKRGASIDEIAEYLSWAESEHMGLSKPSGRIQTIAEKATAIGA